MRMLNLLVENTFDDTEGEDEDKRLIQVQPKEDPLNCVHTFLWFDVGISVGDSSRDVRARGAFGVCQKHAWSRGDVARGPTAFFSFPCRCDWYTAAWR